MRRSNVRDEFYLYHHKNDAGKNQPHLHVMIGLPKHCIDAYTANLFRLFERENKNQRFQKLRKIDVRFPWQLRRWEWMFLYNSKPDYREVEYVFSRFYSKRQLHAIAA